MGKPAPGVKVSLECLALTGTPEEGVTADSLPQVLAHGYVVHEFQVDVQLSSRETDADGRCSTLLPADEKLSPGVYKMVFHTGPYFEASTVSSFYPLVEVSSSPAIHNAGRPLTGDHVQLHKPFAALPYPALTQSVLVHYLPGKLARRQAWGIRVWTF